MRKLLILTLGFSGAVAAAVYFLPGKYLPVCALLLILAAVLLRRRLTDHAGLRCRLFLFAAAAGLLWTWGYDLVFLRPAAQWAGERVEVTGRALEYSVSGVDYRSTVLRITLPDGRACKVQLYDYDGLTPEMEPGDLFSGTLYLRDAGLRQGEETETHHSRGIVMIAYPEGPLHLTGRWEHSWLYGPKHLAHLLSQKAAALWPEDASPLLRGILLGDRTDLRADVFAYQALGVSGILHVVAVSGLHVSILIALLCSWVINARRRALFGLPLVLLFCLLTGMGAPVCRAGFMQSVLLLAPLFGREEDSPTALGAALAILLLGNPHAIAGVSLQLSFAATAGILWLGRPIQSWLLASAKKKKLLLRPVTGRLLRTFAGIVAMSLGANFLTAPLLAAYFGYLSLYSLVTNLLCLWLIEGIFVVGWLILLLGLFLPGPAMALAWVLAWPLRYILAVAQGIATWPHAALFTVNHEIVLWLVLVYIILAIAVITAGRRGFYPWVPASAAIIMLCAVLLFGGNGGGRDSVTVLNVGQGQSVAVLAGESTVVVDCGGNGERNAGFYCAAWLGGQGRSRIDALILTHLHRDHAGGVETLLTWMEVRHLFLPMGADDTDGLYDRIRAAAARRGTEVHSISEDTLLRTGSLEMTLFAPLGTGDANEQGLSCLGAVGAFDFLLTGDMNARAEMALLRHTSLPRLELLVAGHHGSNGSTGHPLLSAVLPERVAISVGYNSYGHPGTELLNRLGEWGTDCYRTDESGDLQFFIESVGE